MDFVCFNGNFSPAAQPLFTAGNRSFRYGDGVFETMKIHDGKILLESFHYDRLFLGLQMLGIENRLLATDLSRLVLELCQMNNCRRLGKVRLAVFRNHENNADFVIEAFALGEDVNRWNEKGLLIDIYPFSRKNADAFSNLKTANFLPYVLAELFAREKEIDDAIVLNTYNNLADSSKANIFLVKQQEILTPALHQGCVNGVMRRYLLEELKKSGYRIHQAEFSEQALLDADEVFLSNSIFDIRWVRQFREKSYSSEQSFSIYQNLIAPFYD